MRMILFLLFAIATAGLLGTATTSAAATSGGAIAKASTATSLVTKVKCRVVRRCSPFGCSYEEVCN